MTTDPLALARQSGALDELCAAFLDWAENHGPIWFDSDARLRDELAAVLGIELRFGDDGA